eukprot:scaffold68752_cov21-Tisochrysis_lutea.AAC.1
MHSHASRLHLRHEQSRAHNSQPRATHDVRHANWCKQSRELSPSSSNSLQPSLSRTPSSPAAGTPIQLGYEA